MHAWYTTVSWRLFLKTQRVPNSSGTSGRTGMRLFVVYYCIIIINTELLLVDIVVSDQRDTSHIVHHININNPTIEHMHGNVCGDFS